MNNGNNNGNNYGHASSGIYGLALIGSLVYYIQHATSFWIGMVGVFKAIFWPAFLIYKALEFFKM